MKNLQHQSGFAVGMIVSVLALMSIVAITAMNFHSNISMVKKINEISKELENQASLINYRLIMCSMVYNDKETGLSQFPDGTDVNVLSLTCPNSPYSDLWSEPDGVRLSPAPSGFLNWKYTKDTTAGTVSYSITASTDIGKKSLNMLGDSLNENSSISGNKLTIDFY